MELSQDQLKKLSMWAAEGQSLSGIQKRMEDEFGLRMTYMQLRFLLDDYSISLANTPEKAKPVEATKPQPQPNPAQQMAPYADPAAGLPVEDPNAAQDAQLAGGVMVDADTIARPGALMSGTVTFSDGVNAKWYLDSMGRLGLDGVDKNYRPTPADVQDFQIELQKILQKKGY